MSYSTEIHWETFVNRVLGLDTEIKDNNALRTLEKLRTYFESRGSIATVSPLDVTSALVQLGGSQYSQYMYQLANRLRPCPVRVSTEQLDFIYRFPVSPHLDMRFVLQDALLHLGFGMAEIDIVVPVNEF
jgi:hypothetical protein